MTLSKLDMCDTSACHLAGLGSVSVKTFRYCRLKLIPRIFYSPHDAKCGLPLHASTIQWSDRIPISQITLSRTNWHHLYRCKTITILFTEKKSAKWCLRSRLFVILDPPFQILIDKFIPIALWCRLNSLLPCCSWRPHSTCWSEDWTEWGRLVCVALFLTSRRILNLLQLYF